MDLKKIKQNKIKLTLLLIVMLQVFLLINLTTANSYMIHQTNNLIENSKIIKKEKNEFKGIINSGINLLIGFLSIKQIGIVSATEDVAWYCCADTCDPIISTNTESCNNVIETSCDETPECELGCCYDTGQGLCTEGSPHAKCTGDGGDWDNDETCSRNECQNGCCILGNNFKFVTETHCTYINGEFKHIWNELECYAFIASQIEGACIKNGACSFTTEASCISNNGQPLTGYLCSHPDINITFGIECEEQDYIDCVDGKDEIYWFDSCGNRENIYEGGTTEAEDRSWNTGLVLRKEDSCGTSSLNANAGSTTCGNCARSLSKCVPSETGGKKVQDGDFICKDLGCKNAPVNAGPLQDRINGEKWCLYDGYIGEGKDTVGSEHWLAYCDEGEVEIDNCNNPYRGKICQEQITEENDRTSSTASCVPNQGVHCIDYNPLQEEEDGEMVNDEENIQKCKDNKHCMIKNVDIDEYFKVNMCVPRYPKGADLDDGMDANICGIASMSCTVYYRNTAAGWECEDNCDCETDEFAEKMNDLCISLGDCGNYINYNGTGTNDNIKIEGKKGKELDSDGEETDEESQCKGLRYDKGVFKEDCAKMDTPQVSWTSYETYKNPRVGQYVEPQNIDEFLAQLEGSGGDYDPNYANVLLIMGGISGAAGTLAIVVSGISNIWTSTTGIFTLATTTTANVGQAAVIFGGFATALSAMAVGVIGAGLLANALGISGIDAWIMMGAGGVVGLMTGLIIIGVDVPGPGWVAAAIAALIIAFLAIFGIGKTETRIVEFTCMPWEAPIFTNFDKAKTECAECNEDPLRPCTKYRCNSLGQTCRILNPDNEENPSCDSIEYEPNPPIISAGEIKTEGYNFDPNDFVNKRIEIKSGESDGCIQEFTSVYFKLVTDEPAQCKYSFEVPAPTYEEMENNYPFELHAFTKNHTFEIWMPSLDSSDAYNVTGDLQERYGNMNMYVRCNDYWDNSNIDEYIVKFCINSEPDGTAVDHTQTVADPRNGATLKYRTNKTDITIWINEPADCRYDTASNQDYEDMTYNMSCTHGLYRPHILGWPCSTKLTNLNSGENKFYIRCKDKPWADTPEEIDEYGERNVNQNDYEYTLYVSGSELKIDSVIFSTTVSDKTITISSGETFSVGGVLSISVDMEVKTSGGMDNGKATCYWGVLEDGSRSLMSPYYTLTNIHTQLLTPRLAGTHINYIECKDEARNAANSIGQFTVIIDRTAPKVIRAYKEGGSLKLKTNEDAKCYYSFKNCDFDFNDENIVSITTGFSTEHDAKWNSGQTYYIVCVDYWGNKDCKKIIPSS